MAEMVVFYGGGGGRLRQAQLTTEVVVLGVTAAMAPEVRVIWWSDALGASSRTWPETRVTQSDSELIYLNNVLQ